MNKEIDNYFPVEILFFRFVPYLRLTPVENLSFEKKHLSYYWQRKIKPSSKDKFISLQKAFDELKKNEKPELNGIIFHLPRSGSTLIAEALSVHPDAVIYSESNIVNGVLNKNDMAIHLRFQYLEQVFAVLKYSLHNVYNNKLMIYKTSSWNLFYYELLRKLFSDIPSLFLHRNQDEVLTSFERKQPNWLKLKSKKNTFWWHVFGEKKMNKLMDDNTSLLKKFLKESETRLQKITNDFDKNIFVSYRQIPGELENIARFFNLPDIEQNMKEMKKRLSYDAIEEVKFFERKK